MGYSQNADNYKNVSKKSDMIKDTLAGFWLSLKDIKAI